jgi:hypothetical protein
MFDGESITTIHAEFCGFRIYRLAIWAVHKLPVILKP